MGKIRLFAFAGALFAAPQLAAAADLLPAPPPLEAPLRGSIAPEVSGWYLRGDVGVGGTRSGEWTFPATPVPAASTLSERITNTSLSGSSFVDLGVGYQVNSWLRFDLTGEFRGAVSGRGLYQGYVNSTTTPCVVGGTAGNCALYQNNYTGTVQSSVLMINGYVDLGTWYGITPFVGGGVGLAYNQTHGFTDNGLNVVGTGINTSNLPNGVASVVAYSPISDRSNTSFAWALMAGLGYEVTPNLRLELAYRYLDLGSAQTGLINCLCAQIFPGFKVTKLASQDLRVGMRWMLGEAVPPPPPPVLVRKY